MLSIGGVRTHRSAGGFDRREFLRVGALGLGGLTLADLLRNEARADAPPSRPKSVIYIVLGGGPSHIDTWDLKPDAPAEYRGEFKPIATKLPGVQICELFPRQAEIMPDLALVRGIRSVHNDHFYQEVYTGLPRSAGRRPAFGSVASRLLDDPSPLPAYVSLSHEETNDDVAGERPYYAGPGHAPFRPSGAALRNLTAGKPAARLDDRKALLAAFDTMRRDLDAGDRLRGLDRFQARALEMIAAPRVREAFDLGKEPVKTVARYGRGKYTGSVDHTELHDWDPKPFVLARRLVEAGVRVVTLQLSGWDHHGAAKQHIFKSYRHVLPVLDQTIYALVSDLKERGLDKDVLVVVLGEFGRTPKLEYRDNGGPGRDHWADAGCALFIGGGLKMGQVVGETDSRAGRSKSGSITFQNVIATVYHVLGVDPGAQLLDFNGRPQNLLDDMTPIRELVN